MVPQAGFLIAASLFLKGESARRLALQCRTNCYLHSTWSAYELYATLPRLSQKVNDVQVFLSTNVADGLNSISSLLESQNSFIPRPFFYQVLSAMLTVVVAVIAIVVVVLRYKSGTESRNDSSSRAEQVLGEEAIEMQENEYACYTWHSQSDRPGKKNTRAKTSLNHY